HGGRRGAVLLSRRAGRVPLRVGNTRAARLIRGAPSSPCAFEAATAEGAAELHQAVGGSAHVGHTGGLDRPQTRIATAPECAERLVESSAREPGLERENGARENPGLRLRVRPVLHDAPLCTMRRARECAAGEARPILFGNAGANLRAKAAELAGVGLL